MNNNMNENVTRILQELTTIRNEVAQVNGRVGNLESQFNHQFAPIDLSQTQPRDNADASMSSSILLVDQEARTRLVIAPNRRGQREIAVNPTNIPRAGLRFRYDTMLQILHQRKTPGSAPLSASKLKALRLAMHFAASALLPTFLVIAPDVTGWDQLDEDDKLFFALLLEDKIYAGQDQLEIFRCQKQWCARHLVSEAYKTYRGQLKRAQEARRRQEERASLTQNSDATMVSNIQYFGN
jgi:hypothetical protein